MADQAPQYARQTVADRRAEAARWVEELRLCCVVLRRSPPDIISSLSLTASLDGTPGSALLALTTGRWIAEEYGLHATMSLHERLLTVRLSRRDGQGWVVDTSGTR